MRADFATRFKCGKEHINYKHGLYKTRQYGIWKGMRSRCYLKTNHVYELYGGRGITICDEWKDDFKAFYDWSVENGYADNLTIDRIDVNKGYSPDNCRWVTQAEQSKNRRNCRWITYKGETKILIDWARTFGCCDETLRRHLKKGETMEEIEKRFRHEAV